MAGHPDLKYRWRAIILPLRLVSPVRAQGMGPPQPEGAEGKSGTIPVMEKPIAPSAFCFEI